MDRNMSRTPQTGKSPLPQDQRASEKSEVSAVQRFSQDAGQRARIDPQRLTPTDVIALQRTIGNAAVQRLLADHTRPEPPVAPFAVRQSNPFAPKASTSTLSKNQHTIQRVVIDDEEEESDDDIVNSKTVISKTDNKPVDDKPVSEKTVSEKTVGKQVGNDTILGEKKRPKILLDENSSDKKIVTTIAAYIRKSLLRKNPHAIMPSNDELYNAIIPLLPIIKKAALTEQPVPISVIAQQVIQEAHKLWLPKAEEIVNKLSYLPTHAEIQAGIEIPAEIEAELEAEIEALTGAKIEPNQKQKLMQGLIQKQMQLQKVMQKQKVKGVYSGVDLRHFDKFDKLLGPNMLWRFTSKPSTEQVYTSSKFWQEDNGYKQDGSDKEDVIIIEDLEKLKNFYGVKDGIYVKDTRSKEGGTPIQKMSDIKDILDTKCIIYIRDQKGKEKKFVKPQMTYKEIVRIVGAHSGGNDKSNFDVKTLSFGRNPAALFGVAASAGGDKHVLNIIDKAEYLYGIDINSLEAKGLTAHAATARMISLFESEYVIINTPGFPSISLDELATVKYKNPFKGTAIADIGVEKHQMEGIEKEMGTIEPEQGKKTEELTQEQKEKILAYALTVRNAATALEGTVKGSGEGDFGWDVAQSSMSLFSQEIKSPGAFAKRSGIHTNKGSGQYGGHMPGSSLGMGRGTMVSGNNTISNTRGSKPTITKEPKLSITGSSKLTSGNITNSGGSKLTGSGSTKLTSSKTSPERPKLSITGSSKLTSSKTKKPTSGNITSPERPKLSITGSSKLTSNSGSKIIGSGENTMSGNEEIGIKPTSSTLTPSTTDNTPKEDTLPELKPSENTLPEPKKKDDESSNNQEDT